MFRKTCLFSQIPEVDFPVVYWIFDYWIFQSQKCGLNYTVNSTQTNLSRTEILVKGRPDRHSNRTSMPKKEIEAGVGRVIRT
jgi:hypothetical protein